jgi:anti-sigma factor RsiW
MYCDKAVNKLSSYIDNELSDSEKQLIEQHIKSCTKCAEELNILLSNEAFLKQLKPIKPSAQFHETLIENIRAKNRDTGAARNWGEILARWWIPVPVICSAFIILFIGFAALSPLAYATENNLKNVSELSKRAFSGISGKNLAGPLNYIEFCNKCHMILCECCKQGQACSCK